MRLILIALIIALIFPLSTFAALNFSNTGSADGVDFGSASHLDTLTSKTMIAWVYPTLSVGANQLRRILEKSTGNGASLMFANGVVGYPADSLFFGVNRATTLCRGVSTANQLTLNAWNFVAGTYDETNGCKAYWGSLTIIAQEVNYDATTQVGAGATTDESTANLWAGYRGSNPNQVTGFQGRIAFTGYWNRVLSLAEIREQQFNPHVTSGNVLFVRLGFGGKGTQPDYSGNANNGTITGDVQIADDPPLTAPTGANEETDGLAALPIFKHFASWSKKIYTTIIKPILFFKG